MEKSSLRETQVTRVLQLIIKRNRKRQTHRIIELFFTPLKIIGKNQLLHKIDILLPILSNQAFLFKETLVKRMIHGFQAFRLQTRESQAHLTKDSSKQPRPTTGKSLLSAAKFYLRMREFQLQQAQLLPITNSNSFQK
jgi:hypothetical protein